jgi:energy-coupling factor transport system permease protein
MRKLAPLTKMLLTLVVTIWSFLIQDVVLLAAITAALTIVIAVSRLGHKAYKAGLSLALFAALLIGFQYLLDTGLDIAVAGGLRMLIMTYLFLLLLGTTRIQDLTAALVTQCRVPYDYAFMFTASLRFIPDLMAEIKAVQEAQACRGYSRKGGIIDRLVSYLSVVQPLILQSISRSETMAMSLELRGFGGSRRTFSSEMALKGKDYGMLFALAAATVYLIAARL